jgi:hypothetical protein
MRRRLARFLFVVVLGSVAMVLGVVTSMILTPPGRDLLARTVSRVLDRVVLGHVEVGAISGSFLYDLVLEDLVVRDTSGVLLADLPRVRVGYRLPNLIAGQVVLSSVQRERRAASRHWWTFTTCASGTAPCGSRCRGTPTARSRPGPPGTPPSRPSGAGPAASSRTARRGSAG